MGYSFFLLVKMKKILTRCFSTGTLVYEYIVNINCITVRHL